ncbi:MAG: hypothetical protein PHD87_04655 [Candidatus Cloacimonetes bacterium]|nr:hypothetical protein [Candidatus Cloacimonadota bacterium]
MPSTKIGGSRIELLARWLLVLLSVWAGVNYFLQGNMVRVLSAVLTVVLFLLFPLLGKLFKISLPLPFKVIWLLFIGASMYLGELHNFFYRFAWWDELIHSGSAMLLTYAGLLLLYVLSRDQRIHLRLGPLLTALAMIWFTLSFGAVWELFEFGVDQVMGLNLLKGRAGTDMSGVYDFQRALLNTMGDLGMDLAGALIVAVAAFFHFRGGGRSFFGRPLELFIKNNPSRFRQDAGPED